MRRRTATAAAALATLLTLTTACGNDDEPKTEPTKAPSPTATTSKPVSPKDQAVEDATKALDRYFAVVNELRTNPKLPITRLKQVAISVGLGYTEQEIKNYRKTPDITRTGDATYELQKILEVSLDNSNPQKGTVPTVQFQVCWDLSETDAVDRNGNSVVNPDRLDQSVATFWVSNYDYKKDPGSGWKVSSLQSKMEKPC